MAPLTLGFAMKIKYTGDEDEITLRGVTFAKNEAVELDMSDEKSASLAKKCLSLDFFKQVKTRRRADGDKT